MSTYRRSARQKRCQRWDFDSQTWHDCAFDEPETRTRKPKEGMVVGPCEDFALEGPLIVSTTDLIAAAERMT